MFLSTDGISVRTILPLPFPDIQHGETIEKKSFLVVRPELSFLVHFLSFNFFLQSFFLLTSSSPTSIITGKFTKRRNQILIIDFELVQFSSAINEKNDSSVQFSREKRERERHVSSSSNRSLFLNYALAQRSSWVRKVGFDDRIEIRC